jgi:hypothetical protein
MKAFMDGMALIVAVPSRTQNGVYLVRCEPAGLNLIVSHDCPAAYHGKLCWHIQEAVAAYERVHWWEPKKEVVLTPRRIVLQPDWRQVSIPLNPVDWLRTVIHDAS